MVYLSRCPLQEDFLTFLHRSSLKRPPFLNVLGDFYDPLNHKLSTAPVVLSGTALSGACRQSRTGGEFDAIFQRPFGLPVYPKPNNQLTVELETNRWRRVDNMRDVFFTSSSVC